MGTNMYISAALLDQNKDASIVSLPVNELIEKADGFAGVFPEHKYEIVKRLQEKKHICGLTVDGVNDAPALKKANIGIAVVATDAARGASDIIYTFSITIRIVFGFMFIDLIWKFDFSPFMVLIIAILNDGTIMTICKDRVKPSPMPDSWKLKEIFATGIVLGVMQDQRDGNFFEALRHNYGKPPSESEMAEEEPRSLEYTPTCKLPHESSSPSATEHFYLLQSFNNGRRHLLSEGSESQYCAYKVAVWSVGLLKEILTLKHLNKL